MIENKKLIKRKAEHISAEIYDLLELVQKADSHEEQTILQVIDELGFEEDINDIAQKFDNLAERLDRAEIIDGYQVWIGLDNYQYLNVIAGNRHIQIARSEELETVFEILLKNTENRQQAKNILKWYFEKVY